MDKFILILFRAGHKIRVSTLYHLLKGKQTISVLVNGFFYDNLNYLGLFSGISQADFQKELDRLQYQQFLMTTDNVFYQITDQGRKELETNPFLKFSALNNYRYGRYDLECWRLTAFAVQVISEVSYHNKEYLPLEAQPFYLQSIKRWLQKLPEDAVELLYLEMKEVFTLLSDEESNYLANQLSGHQTIGKVGFQLIPTNYQNQLLSYFFHKNVLHAFFAVLPQGQLKRLIDPLLQQNLNQSMLKTRSLYLKGLSIPELQKTRKLKQGTIFDHLIEWAIIDDTFPFEKNQSKYFLGRDLNDVREWQFEDFNQDISFLEFRLMQIAIIKGVF